MPSLTKLTERMRYWCQSVSLGYDQYNRWDIRPGGECDCSSLVIWVLREAGFDTGNASYTGNLSANLIARGWKRLPNNGNPQPGDILLNDVHHVAVYLGGGLLAQASIDERGRAYGGQAGDQTGYETNVRSYYNYPWNCYLRYTGTTTDTNDTQEDTDMSMACIIQPNDESRLIYFDGTKCHNLTHPDQVTALQTVAQQTMGKQLPVFKLGTKSAPFATRLLQAVGQ
ncbi:peptidoglycan hydrolase [Bifidobacterium goeldii]|uniref:Peptidoglycan hydrolase n=1 Tax=Bifidobacterium goeldii TaxID=2306975 RepID=A0A430FM26_9BIFI|nr:NlpC/P60 family protein [Bifidobacterium goeldii]RSX53926.1 peptidoglycan hydrolase [Bifidobacterium goeldii]